MNDLSVLSIDTKNYWISEVKFSPNGKLLAVGTSKGDIILWEINPSTGLKLDSEIKLTGHESWVNSIAFSSDSLVLASVSDDQTIRLWDLDTKKEVVTFEEPCEQTAIAFCPGEDNLLAIGNSDGVINLRDLRVLPKIEIVNSLFEGTTEEEDLDHGIESIAFSPDGMSLLSGSIDGSIKLWDAPSGLKIEISPKGDIFKEAVLSVAFSPNSNLIAAGGNDCTVRLWDVSTGNKIASLGGHQSPIKSIAFSPDSNIVASANGDRTITLWDVNTKEQLCVLTGHERSIFSVAFSPNGQIIASGDSDGILKLWKVPSRQ